MSNDTKKTPSFCMLFIFYAVLTSASFASSDDQKGLADGAPFGEFKTNILFIIADFPNEPWVTTENNWREMQQKVVDYYHQVSYGKVTLNPNTHETYGQLDNGIIKVTLDKNYSSYRRDYPLSTIRHRHVMRDALIKADSYIDYSQYDDNNDGFIGTDELAIAVIAAGTGKGGASRNLNAEFTLTLDGVTIGHTTQTTIGNHVTIQNELRLNSDKNSYVASFGVLVHEYGHSIFKMRDLYLGRSGIGRLGLMGAGDSGKLTTQIYSGETPVMPSPWMQMKLGWVTALEASGTESIVAMGSNRATPLNTVFKVSTNDPDEYFLIANIQNLGFNRGLQRNTNFSQDEGGLIIYHIDESQFTSDGLVAIEKPGMSGIPNGTHLNKIPSVLWREGQASTFNNTSVPNSNKRDGSSTGINIHSISTSAEVMTATFVNSISQKPKAPANLSVFYRTQTTASYGFTDVSDNEQGYKIYLNNALKETLTTINGSRSFTIEALDNLSPNTSYTLRVDVFNANGTTRGPSKSFRTKSSAVSQKPKAPANLSVFYRTQTTASYGFTDVSDNEQGYKIYLNNALKETLTTISGSRSFTIEALDNLSPNTSYTLRVDVFNANGTTRGPSQSFRTEPSAVSQKPKAPANLSVFYRTQTTASYGFTDVSDNEQGYKIYLNNALKETLTTINGSRSFTIEVIDSLSPNTSYTLRVDVFNANGTTRGPSKSFRTKAQ